MKSLANCKPSEFLRQTNRIKKSAEKWLKATNILHIRESVPEFVPLPKDPKPTFEQIKAHEEEYKEQLKQASKENLSKMLDAILDEHPDETLELLALICFVEPKDVDNHTLEEYIDTINDLISNEKVINFFTSLMRLVPTDISKR